MREWKFYEEKFSRHNKYRHGFFYIEIMRESGYESWENLRVLSSTEIFRFSTFSSLQRDVIFPNMFLGKTRKFHFTFNCKEKSDELQWNFYDEIFLFDVCRDVCF